MELIELIHPGMTSEEIFLVEERHLATHVGSGAAGTGNSLDDRFYGGGFTSFTG